MQDAGSVAVCVDREASDGLSDEVLQPRRATRPQRQRRRHGALRYDIHPHRITGR